MNVAKGISSFVLLLFTLATLHGCSKEPGPVGTALFGGQVQFDSLSLLADSSRTYRDSISGVSENLLIGRFQDFEARTLLQFSGLPVIAVDSIVDARITLVTQYWFGDSSGRLEYTIHRIERSWEQSRIKFDSTLTLFDPSPVGRFSNIISPGDTVVDSVSTDLVRHWMSNPQYGIILIPTKMASTVYGFRSVVNFVEDSRPLLVVRYRNGGVIDSVSVRAVQYMFVATAPTPPASDQFFVVQAGLADRGLVQFDVGAIPRSATIHSAILTLTRDLSAVIPSQYASDSVLIQFVTRIDTIRGSFAVTASRNGNPAKFSGDIRTMVQQWVTGTPNYGVAVRAYNEFLSLDRYVFSGYGSGLNAPKLEIKYNTLRE
jgi:hypothetical protein